MKLFSGILFFLLTAVSLEAQDAEIRRLQQESLRPVRRDVPDTGQYKWRKGGSYSLQIGQGSQSNWAAGGDDFSFTVHTALRLYAFHKKPRYHWDNTLDLNFGFINTTSLGSRKNDDRFDLFSKYGFTLTPKFNLATLANFRSQFLHGYTYPGNVKTFASAFLSPAYLVVSQGIDYKPTRNFSVFISPLTSRWVFVRDSLLSSKGEYGVDRGRHSVSQNGAFATIGFQKSFNKVVTYSSRVDVFSNYKKDPQNIDLYMTSTLTARIAKMFAFSWNLDMIYDNDVQLFGPNGDSPAIQLKSIIGLGLQVKI